MENFDWGYLVVALLAGVASISKSVKKRRAESNQGTAPKSPIFSAQDILRKVMEEMGEKDDDFFPRSPSAPRPAPATQPNAYSTKPSPAAYSPLKKPAPKPARHDDSSVSIENTPRRSGFEKEKPLLPVEDDAEGVGYMLQLDDPDDLKKAVIYSEILRPKF